MHTSMVVDAETETVFLSGLCPRCLPCDCTGWESLSAPACPRCGTPAQQVGRDDAGRSLVLLTEIWIG